MQIKNFNGFSLLSALVAISVISIGAVAFLKMNKSSIRSQHHASLKADKLAIAQMILNSTACDLALPSGSCTPGNLLKLERRHTASATTSVLVSDAGAGSKYGTWTPRAVCNATGDGVLLQMTRLSSSGNLHSTHDNKFAKDPLTGKIIKWSDPESYVFGVGVEMCSDGNMPFSIENSCVTKSTSFGGPIGLGTGIGQLTCDDTNHRIVSGGGTCTGTVGRFFMESSTAISSNTWKITCCSYDQGTGHMMCNQGRGTIQILCCP
ncbi:MAG: hypothetical protein R3B45_12750 [Bdellovibrionota bacterium]